MLCIHRAALPTPEYVVALTYWQTQTGDTKSGPGCCRCWAFGGILNASYATAIGGGGLVTPCPGRHSRCAGQASRCDRLNGLFDEPGSTRSVLAMCDLCRGLPVQSRMLCRGSSVEGNRQQAVIRLNDLKAWISKEQ